MDKSEKYILMCEKFNKIISPHETCLYPGDIAYSKQFGIGYVTRWEAYLNHCETQYEAVFFDGYGIKLFDHTGDFFCGELEKLWRQDQLQELVDSNNAYTLHKEFVAWMDKNQDEDWLIRMRFSSEQLWLAYLCTEKYNKVWDGSDWQPAGEG